MDLCKGHRSPLTGLPVAVIGAGGIFDGRGVAAALALGAQAVWIGTRFVAATESGAGPRHKQMICEHDSESTVRTLIFSGRPMRVFRNDYIADWERNRADERNVLLAQGERCYKHDLKRNEDKGTPLSFLDTYPVIYGQACGGITKVQTSKEIMDEMMATAVAVLQQSASLVVVAKL